MKYVPFSSKISIYFWASPRNIVMIEEISEVLPMFVRKALHLVIPTVLEIFYQEFVRKTLLLITPTILKYFLTELVQKSPTFGYSYSTIKISTRFVHIIKKAYFW